MRNFFKKAETKVMGAYIGEKYKVQELGARAKDAVMNREGQGTLDVAITVLISIVLGALILAGLYLIVNGTVLPSITQKIKEMFNYKG